MFLLSNLCLYFIVIMWIQHALLPYRINDFHFHFHCIFIARRYARAIYAVVMCPSFCLSVRHKPVSYRNDWTSRAPSPYSILCYKKSWISPKIRVLPSGTMSKTNFVTARRSVVLSTKLVMVVVDGRVCWRHLYDNRWVVAVYYKSPNCNSLTPLPWFVVGLLYNLFLQLTIFWLT